MTIAPLRITIVDMKQLTDTDIEQMIADEFSPDPADAALRRGVRAQLRLGTLIPPPKMPVPEFITLDLHNHTIEMAWARIMDTATSGTRRAKIITGASGVLHELFQDWVRDSILSPYVISCTPINNGSFDVRFHRIKKTSA